MVDLILYPQKHCLVVWNTFQYCSFSSELSSQLMTIFFRGCETTKIEIICGGLFMFVFFFAEGFGFFLASWFYAFLLLCFFISLLLCSSTRTSLFSLLCFCTSVPLCLYYIFYFFFPLVSFSHVFLVPYFLLLCFLSFWFSFSFALFYFFVCILHITIQRP